MNQETEAKLRQQNTLQLQSSACRG